MYLFDIIVNEGPRIPSLLHTLHSRCASKHFFDIIPSRQLNGHGMARVRHRVPK